MHLSCFLIISFQCPNPDFNKEQNRWRMVRRMLVEAVVDLLHTNGQVFCVHHCRIKGPCNGSTSLGLTQKIWAKQWCIVSWWRETDRKVRILRLLLQAYLQSDVESVLLVMKEQFLSYSKGQLVTDGDGDHRIDNPFGVVSDWERHVLARGAPMYRTMLKKIWFHCPSLKFEHCIVLSPWLLRTWTTFSDPLG